MADNHSAPRYSFEEGEANARGSVAGCLFSEHQRVLGWLRLMEDYFSGDQQPNRDYSRQRFRTTARHRELVTNVRSLPGTWAQQALLACLEHLLVSRTTEAWCVGIVDAYLDDDDGFCVIYRFGTYRRTIGLRRGNDADHPCVYGDSASDIGQEIADFDIGEPLGTVASRLSHDPSTGVWWWGDKFQTNK